MNPEITNPKITNHKNSINEVINDEDTWEVVKAFSNEYTLTEHQISSYNELVTHTIPRILERDNTIESEGYTIHMSNSKWGKPSHKELNDVVRDILPGEAMKRDIPYNAKQYLDFTVKTPVKNEQGIIKSYETKTYFSVLFGILPVLVRSCLCNKTPIQNDYEKLAKEGEDIYDLGGYFIMKGGAVKVISSQQQTASNQIYVFQKRIKVPKFDTYAEVRSCDSYYRSNATYVGIKKSIISVTIPYVDGIAIPIGILFAALGCKDIDHMLSYITSDKILTNEWLVPTLEKYYPFLSQSSALIYIGTCGKKFNKRDERSAVNSAEDDMEDVLNTNKESYAKHLLENEFLPHLGKGAFEEKRVFVGLMTKRLLQVLSGRRKLTNRDDYGIKVISRIGDLMGALYNSSFKKFRKEIIKSIEKKVKQNDCVNIMSIIKPTIIQTCMSNAITSNMWTGKKKTPGISQAYERFNYSATLANIRKLFTSINPKGGKIEGPRQVDNSHLMTSCPAETPEGKKCGLVTYLAMTGMVVTGSDVEDTIEFFRNLCKHRNLNVSFISEGTVHDENATLIQINGRPIAYTNEPLVIESIVKSYRRNCDITPETEVCYSGDNILSIRVDFGRLTRPLLIVKDGKLKLTQKVLDKLRNMNVQKCYDISNWNYLLKKGIVEFVDKFEESESNIVMYPSDLMGSDSLNITHCELHPSLMYGVGAAKICLSNCNQSPRNAYHAAMIKQAIGIPSLTWKFQTKSKVYALNYPHKALITTKASDIFGLEKLPNVQNVVVAICPWYGFGQEDSVLLNEDSIKRGLFSTTILIPYYCKIKSEKHEVLEIPKEEECDNFRGNATLLNPLTGYVNRGQKVIKNDVLIGITILINAKSMKKRSISILYDQNIPGIVHNIDIGIDGDGYRYVRVIIAQLREPEIGDKFSTSSGQKGTAGNCFRSINAPYCANSGIVPDVIMNPLAFPSRMTIGVLIEMLSGRAICSGNALHNISISKVWDEESPNWEVPDGEHKPLTNEVYNDCSRFQDGTPFRKDSSYADVGDELKKLGINEFSEEIMINGETGEVMQFPIFFAICPYMRLKHMVADKVHARSKGGRTRITRQPKEGRRLGGGFRLGTMERDIIFANGCPYIIRDRLLEQSDITTMCFCMLCGLQAVVKIGDPKTRTPPTRMCNVCDTTNIGIIHFPYATKLVIQELMGMCIAIRVMLTPYSDVTGEVVIYGGERVIGTGILGA